MFHFQTSQRFRSDVDPCYLRNKEKKSLFSPWLGAEPAGQGERKATAQPGAQRCPNMMATQGRESNGSAGLVCFCCGKPSMGMLEDGLLRRWELPTLSVAFILEL